MSMPTLVDPWMLRYGDEVCDPQSYFSGIVQRKANREEKRLLAELIDQRKRRWGPELAKDPVHEALLDMLAAKQKHIKRTRKKGRAGGGATWLIL